MFSRRKPASSIQIFDARRARSFPIEGQLSETAHLHTEQLTNQFLFAASLLLGRSSPNTNGITLGKTSLPYVLIPEGFESGCVMLYPNDPDPNDPNNHCVRTFDWDNSVNYSDFIGGEDMAFPQGRNVTGYQFNDDLTWIKGKNTWKFGYTFRRDDITDYTSSEDVLQFGGGRNYIFDQSNFAAGYSDEWYERFPQRLSQPVAMYVEGWYAQDQYKPIPNLTLTLGLRMEHNSNPLCRTNCVSNFAQDFSQLPTVKTTPYNQLGMFFFYGPQVPELFHQQETRV